MHMMLNILQHNYNNCTFRRVGCNLIQEIEATTTIHSLHVEKNGGQEVGMAGPRILQGIMNILREMMNKILVRTLFLPNFDHVSVILLIISWECLHS